MSTVSPVAVSDIVVSTIVVPAIVTRMRIALVIRQRVPADVVSKRYVEHKRDEGRPPPTALAMELTARTPGPGVVVVDPTAVVIRRPTPRFMSDPGPTVRWTPRPLPITIRRPIVVGSDHACARHPHPAVVVGVPPITVSIEIFRAPNVFVKILNVLFGALREMALTLVYPIVNSVVGSGREQFPVAGVVSVSNEHR